ncbi:carbon-nitrogen hydrolase family protein [Phototrophicus methaneseepsis]|uniref:Carbon-nitrogen hydrolase family protein n=1 Tax=Phototrophicus methaneseepsis TaxID=2710758 RepID=A0A7S8IGB6_9CHLR|nr:carbon-nitrogen hydrolase family protein [Phototrophicus methaneseepsis]QPC83848.1 carbon-nitrogen hydrolase family protein [Phototrophicus methaneseepsis]
MKMLKIALLQLFACGNDQTANLAKGEKYCRQAAEQGVDIVVFPEMWNIGYTPYSEDVWREDFDPLDSTYDSLRQEWYSQAVSADSPFVQHFCKLAKELDLAIVLTYLEKWDGLPRNSASLINRHGDIVYTYAKVHTCDFSLEAACSPGDEFYVDSLDTAIGAVKIGTMICYDREFPESARALMLKGAEVILTPNACDLEINRLSQFRGRAFENMVAVAMTNYAGMGHSIAYDGIAFDENGSRDMKVVEADEAEGIYIAKIDIDRLREYRQSEVWGNAFRKPRSYSNLTETTVNFPFQRHTSRR